MVLTVAAASVVPMTGPASAATQAWSDCRSGYACFFQYSNGGGWLYERWGGGDGWCGSWDFPSEYRNNTTSVYNRGRGTVYLYSETGMGGDNIGVVYPGQQLNMGGDANNNAASVLVC
ncbi:hypothetical protein GCM10010384_03220 [Streptomyces djakartensis]|uniref:Peptidase inhibitor family I36 n=1 Tax=Streptomyces djakartensis TaxID=68193 RepID=A0ABQ2Z3V9_9ACTN|nr:hypothetical protein GCM10010384_03220 [Streptomyces djakartensis]